ncbi:hypothetical protein Tco_0118322 [Tanacetum coccineum]
MTGNLKLLCNFVEKFLGTVWYPKDSGFELTAFSDADHARCLDTRKSTFGGIQFLGDKLKTDITQKDEKRSQNDKTGHGMEKHGKDKVQSNKKPEKVNRKSTPISAKPKVKKNKFRD